MQDMDEGWWKSLSCDTLIKNKPVFFCLELLLKIKFSLDYDLRHI